MGFDVSSLAKLQAKPMLEMGPALPNGMVEVAQEILKTSKSLQVGKLNLCSKEPVMPFNVLLQFEF